VMAPRKAQRMRLAAEGKAQRKSVPGAKKGAYPTDTKGRARSAKSRASHAESVGRISAATERSIDARADKELGKGRKPKRK
jgi:hypothetical protein